MLASCQQGAPLDVFFIHADGNRFVIEQLSQNCFSYRRTPFDFRVDAQIMHTSCTCHTSHVLDWCCRRKWAPMSSSTAASQTNNEARVLVLGGGLAGLKCVHDLVSKHGFTEDHVVLLEASTSIGGRIKTDTSFVEGFKVGVYPRCLADTLVLYITLYSSIGGMSVWIRQLRYCCNCCLNT